MRPMGWGVEGKRDGGVMKDSEEAKRVAVEGKMPTVAGGDLKKGFLENG
jgi:hypothetical protein